MSRHRFYGDTDRFDIVAAFIAERYWQRVRYIADVAGGQGMLARILNKKYHFQCDVIDPRGWVLKGIQNRAEEFNPAQAEYYDLIVGLHCDEALREVAACARIRPVVLVPCCNFWAEEKLGQFELLAAIEEYYHAHKVQFERVTFAFKGPKNIGLVSEPPK
ncbi:MAG: hypothetical protein EHM21_00720 [Chloroflexi bacterium]|nr:MAG: hypothetical protein EHM21_00720 [Chloroflexota bacterium]